MESDTEETIDSKVEEAPENISDNDEYFDLKIQNTVKVLLQPIMFCYSLHHPESYSATIVNGKRLVTWNLNKISSSSKT